MIRFRQLSGLSVGALLILCLKLTVPSSALKAVDTSKRVGAQGAGREIKNGSITNWKISSSSSGFVQETVAGPDVTNNKDSSITGEAPSDNSLSLPEKIQKDDRMKAASLADSNNANSRSSSGSDSDIVNAAVNSIPVTDLAASNNNSSTPDEETTPSSTIGHYFDSYAESLLGKNAGANKNTQQIAGRAFEKNKGKEYWKKKEVLKESDHRDDDWEEDVARAQDKAKDGGDDNTEREGNSKGSNSKRISALGLLLLDPSGGSPAAGGSSSSSDPVNAAADEDLMVMTKSLTEQGESQTSGLTGTDELKYNADGSAKTHRLGQTQLIQQGNFKTTRKESKIPASQMSQDQLKDMVMPPDMGGLPPLPPLPQMVPLRPIFRFKPLSSRSLSQRRWKRRVPRSSPTLLEEDLEFTDRFHYEQHQHNFDTRPPKEVSIGRRSIGDEALILKVDEDDDGTYPEPVEESLGKKFDTSKIPPQEKLETTTKRATPPRQKKIDKLVMLLNPVAESVPMDTVETNLMKRKALNSLLGLSKSGSRSLGNGAYEMPQEEEASFSFSNQEPNKPDSQFVIKGNSGTDRHQQLENYYYHHNHYKPANVDRGMLFLDDEASIQNQELLRKQSLKKPVAPVPVQRALVQDLGLAYYTLKPKEPQTTLKPKTTGPASSLTDTGNQWYLAPKPKPADRTLNQKSDSGLHIYTNNATVARNRGEVPDPGSSAPSRSSYKEFLIGSYKKVNQRKPYASAKVQTQPPAVKKSEGLSDLSPDYDELGPAPSNQALHNKVGVNALVNGDKALLPGHNSRSLDTPNIKESAIPDRLVGVGEPKTVVPTEAPILLANRSEDPRQGALPATPVVKLGPAAAGASESLVTLPTTHSPTQASPEKLVKTAEEINSSPQPEPPDVYNNSSTSPSIASTTNAPVSITSTLSSTLSSSNEAGQSITLVNQKESVDESTTPKVGVTPLNSTTLPSKGGNTTSLSLLTKVVVASARKRNTSSVVGSGTTAKTKETTSKYFKLRNPRRKQNQDDVDAAVDLIIDVSHHHIHKI